MIAGASDAIGQAIAPAGRMVLRDQAISESMIGAMQKTSDRLESSVRPETAENQKGHGEPGPRWRLGRRSTRPTDFWSPKSCWKRSYVPRILRGRRPIRRADQAYVEQFARGVEEIEMSTVKVLGGCILIALAGGCSSSKSAEYYEAHPDERGGMLMACMSGSMSGDDCSHAFVAEHRVSMRRNAEIRQAERDFINQLGTDANRSRAAADAAKR